MGVSGLRACAVCLVLLVPNADTFGAKEGATSRLSTPPGDLTDAVTKVYAEMHRAEDAQMDAVSGLDRKIDALSTRMDTELSARKDSDRVLADLRAQVALLRVGTGAKAPADAPQPVAVPMREVAPPTPKATGIQVAMPVPEVTPPPPNHGIQLSPMAQALVDQHTPHVPPVWRPLAPWEASQRLRATTTAMVLCAKTSAARAASPALPL